LTSPDRYVDTGTAGVLAPELPVPWKPLTAGLRARLRNDPRGLRNYPRGVERSR